MLIIYNVNHCKSFYNHKQDFSQEINIFRIVYKIKEIKNVSFGVIKDALFSKEFLEQIDLSDFFKECLIGKRINKGSKRFKEIKKKTFEQSHIYKTTELQIRY